MDIVRFFGQFKATADEGCWLWAGPNNGCGYGRMYHDWGWTSAHRAAYTFANGKIPEGQCVCHRCDTPLCVRPSHLFLGTHADNMADMVKKGRAITKHGEEHGRAMITLNDARRVHKMRRDTGLSAQAIAEELGLPPGPVHGIIHCGNWPQAK